MAGELVGIGTLFHHVDLALASAHLLTDGPFSGDMVFQYDESGGNIGLTSGIAFVATTIPEFWGRKIGFNGILFGHDVNEDEYNPPWASFVNWTLLVRGLYLATGRRAFSHAIEYVLWEETLPQAVTVHAEPGWEYDAYTIHL